jgi:hypothetical protein
MKPAIFNSQAKSFGLAIATMAICASVAVHAQVIDPLNGTVNPPYTSYAVNDTGLGNGDAVSNSEASGSLVPTAIGPTSTAEQELYLASASSFSTVFAVGDTLSVAVNVPAGSTAEDIGLAISANNPVSGNAGDTYNSRALFDWASISVRPSQTSIRQNTSINGTLTTGSFVLSPVAPATVTGLFITWVSPLTFQLGYLTSAGAVLDDTVTFEAGSTIGQEIGFYNDLRTTGASIGSLTNLTISTPEPSTLALCGLGLAGLFGARKFRKK